MFFRTTEEVLAALDAYIDARLIVSMRALELVEPRGDVKATLPKLMAAKETKDRYRAELADVLSQWRGL